MMVHHFPLGLLYHILSKVTRYFSNKNSFTYPFSGKLHAPAFIPAISGNNPRKRPDIGALLEGNGIFASFLVAFSLQFLLQLSAVQSIILVSLSPARAVGRKRILK
ncbi:MAG: hypothetical protein SPI15_03075 [Candidatus Faecousia sp.]|nr:hypothetical protein [Candidatus Faecousia sp.]